jgi:hypothetical protein
VELFNTVEMVLMPSFTVAKVIISVCGISLKIQFQYSTCEAPNYWQQVQLASNLSGWPGSGTLEWEIPGMREVEMRPQDGNQSPSAGIEQSGQIDVSFVLDSLIA